MRLIGWGQRDAWANLNAIGTVRSRVEEKGERRTQTRYFITSLTNIKEFAQAAREHWGIKNQLHWYLDVIFREDASRAKRGNSPLNLNVMRKTALPFYKPPISVVSVFARRCFAPLCLTLLWNISFLEKSKCCCPDNQSRQTDTKQSNLRTEVINLSREDPTTYL